MVSDTVEIFIKIVTHCGLDYSKGASSAVRPKSKIMIFNVIDGIENICMQKRMVKLSNKKYLLLKGKN